MSRHPSQGPGVGGPARRYSREPFKPGNLAAVRHGARSPRLVEPLAAEAIELLTSSAPWLASSTFEASLAAWGRTEAKIALVSTYLDEVGVLDDDGQPRPAVELVVRLERLAADLRGRLGLDPSSAARIARDLSTSVRDEGLATLVDEGRRLRLAAESEAAP